MFQISPGTLTFRTGFQQNVWCLNFKNPRGLFSSRLQILFPIGRSLVLISKTLFQTCCLSIGGLKYYENSILFNFPKEVIVSCLKMCLSDLFYVNRILVEFCKKYNIHWYFIFGCSHTTQADSLFLQWMMPSYLLTWAESFLHFIYFSRTPEPL